jgi:hypothetical protein
MGRFDELNGQQLDMAYAATEVLLSMAERLDPTLAAKLGTLRADLDAERQEPRRLAQS